jgi:hypothetical protein
MQNDRPGDIFSTEATAPPRRRRAEASAIAENVPLSGLLHDQVRQAIDAEPKVE